ncbi:hypothetical protein BJ170DRAFT_307460 [Xylariales sp. AK1849]|nr:hypothetical protein BJ170DRAFT_307460 [Xylariales sp. AK1849]
MYSTRLIRLVLVALSVVTAAQAAWFDLGFIGKSKTELVARQGGDASSTSSASAAASTSSTSSSVISTTTSSTQATTTSVPPTTTTPTSTPTTTTPTTTANPTTPTTTTPTSTPTITTPTTTAGTSSTDSLTTTSSSATETDDSTTATTTPTPITSVVVVTQTNSAGEVTGTTSSSVVVTPTASLSQSGSNTSTGMDDSTKKTIIGVCVGVGSAIILAVAGVLFWRLRRRRQNEDGEDLVNYGAGTSQFNSGAPEKSEASGSASGRSPFQSTLESYHAPTQSNTGTNF